MESRRFVADFETTTDIDNCFVWGFGISEIGNLDNFIYGTTIDDFINFCKNKKENYIIYFHNLKFDGEFIIYYLLKNGYKVIKDSKDKEDKTFTTLISFLGEFYSIEIFFEVKKTKVNKVTIFDSLKIIRSSVDNMAKMFDLPIQKTKIDYNKKREKGYILTDKEIEYIKNDVEIVSIVMDKIIKSGLTKMTIGANALSHYKKINKNFRHYFPLLDIKIDKVLRLSYKGGYTYLNPIYQNKKVKSGIALDVNSLYPYVMKSQSLPFGTPVFFEGKYVKDDLYNLYTQTFSCIFDLKEGKLPTLQIKNNLNFIPNEYLTTSNNEIVTLNLTNVDLELFFENYNIKELNYHFGFKFKSVKGLFSDYVDYWMNQKNEHKKDGNKILYMVSKLMLNSLYGKFGLNPNIISKYPVLEDDVVKYKNYDEEVRDSVYLPIALFITAYGRKLIIETSQKIREYSLNKYKKDLYVYSDTDSVHCLIDDENELKDIIKIDDYEIGAFKVETRFEYAKFLRQKCYIEKEVDKNMIVKIAGLPRKLGKYVNIDNFKKGFELLESNKDIDHKLDFKHVKGGIVLVDRDFSIK